MQKKLSTWECVAMVVLVEVGWADERVIRMGSSCRLADQVRLLSK